MVVWLSGDQDRMSLKLPETPPRSGKRQPTLTPATSPTKQRLVSPCMIFNADIRDRKKNISTDFTELPRALQILPVRPH